MTGVQTCALPIWSWALESSWAGNDNIARTAHESFRIDFGLTDPAEAHGAVKDVWEYMLENPSRAISQHFGLEDMNEYNKPWFIDAPGFGSDWEAEIGAKDYYGRWVPDSSDFGVQEFYYQAG